MTNQQIAAMIFAGALLLLNGIVLVVGLIKHAPSTTGFLRSEHGQRWSSIILVFAVVVCLLAVDLLTDPVLILVSSIGGFTLGRSVSSKID